MYYSTTHEVRFSDVDRFGHVNHLRLLEFFESARNPFLADLAAADGQPNVLDSQGFVVAHLAADFHLALDPQASSVEVRTMVRQLGTSSATLRYELWHEVAHCVTATTVLVFISGGQKAPLTEERRAFFAAYLMPEDPATEGS